MERNRGDHLSARFLGSFNRVDAALARVALPEKPHGFADRLRVAAARSELVAEHADDIRLLSRLRNAIVHESRGSTPIAEPHVETVDLIERLARLLENPPLLVHVLDQDEIVTCRDVEAIGPVIERMHREDFSQVPVLSDGCPVRLMTAETVLHWMAASSGTPSADDRVSDVMRHGDGCDAVSFLGADATVGDALGVFRAAELDEHRIWAIVVTATGGEFDDPVAIATSSDLLALHKAVAL